MPRPPGTWRMPASVIRWASYVVMALPSNMTSPARRHHQTGDGPHQRGLAGAVGAEHRHHLAVAHIEVDAEEDLDAVVAGIERADHEEMAHPVGPFLAHDGVRRLGDLALRDVLGHESGRRTKQRRADDEQRHEDPERSAVAEGIGDEGIDGGDRRWGHR